MSGKHEINTDAGIPDKVLWLMCKNDRELFFPRVFIISGLFLLFSLIIPNTFVTKQRLQSPIRKTFIVQSDQPELRIPPGYLHNLIIQNNHPGTDKPIHKLVIFRFLKPIFMIACDIVYRTYFHDLIHKLDCAVYICVI